ncbi:MAG TPA: hypothetical protein VK783_16575 [Bacteroidia bacterium]|nr:hypothetical protein [Bacteroidia bacterium]
MERSLAQNAMVQEWLHAIYVMEEAGVKVVKRVVYARARDGCSALNAVVMETSR